MASSICDRLRRGVLRLAVVLVVVGPRPAAAVQAPEPGAKSEARAKLVEGVALLKERRYAEALERFKAAYALVPSPLIQYDFGLAQLGLGDRPRALEAFETFLREAPDAPADKQQKAAAYRDELRQQVAVVELTADVKTAELAVDGVNVGPVSFPRRIYLASGSHELEARVGVGGEARAATVMCEAGQTMSVAIRLSLPSSGASAAGGGASPGALALAPVDAVRPPALLETSGSPPPAAPPSRARLWALSVAGAGVVAAGAGVVFGVLAKNDSDALTDDARNERDFVPATETSGLRNQRLETVFLSVGAAAIVAGASLYAMVRHREAVHRSPGPP